MIRNRNSRRELGRKRGLASAAAWQPREPDADTLRMRALWDARGEVLRRGVTYKSTCEVQWAVTRSIRGRINQFDVIVNGSVWATAGARRLKAKGIQI